MIGETDFWSTGSIWSSCVENGSLFWSIWFSQNSDICRATIGIASVWMDSIWDCDETVSQNIGGVIDSLLICCSVKSIDYYINRSLLNSLQQRYCVRLRSTPCIQNQHNTSQVRVWCNEASAGWSHDFWRSEAKHWNVVLRYICFERLIWYWVVCIECNITSLVSYRILYESQTSLLLFI